MKRMRYWLIALIALLIGGGCFKAPAKDFSLPKVPNTLTEPKDRAEYLALHYWDNFDAGNDTLLNNRNVTEQGFSNFLSIMPLVASQGDAFAKMYERMGSNPKMLAYFIDLTEKYLYEINSPFCDEELYIVALTQLMELPQLGDADKERTRFRLSTAKKNRIGYRATNFEFLLKDGSRDSLYSVESDLLLLYFNDPTCEACQITKSQLLEVAPMNEMIEAGRLKVLAVTIDATEGAWRGQTLPEGWIDAYDEENTVANSELYDLPSLPVIYLLDKEHRVLLKNTTVDRLEHYLLSSGTQQ